MPAARLNGAQSKRVNAQRKVQRLNTRREERALFIRQRLDAWFKEFDTNSNGSLERDELRQLLHHLYPDSPPPESMLDMLIEKATAVESYSLTLRGSKDGSVSRMAAQKTLERYDAYMRQKKRLDEIFFRNDVNQSGKLERAEVLSMMNEVVARTPGLQHVIADEGDVEFLLGRAGLDGDLETITRDELLPALALWKELAQRKDEHAEKELLQPKYTNSGRSLSMTRTSWGYDSRVDGKGSTACAIL